MLPAFKAYIEGNKGLIGKVAYLRESTIGYDVLVVERFEELPDYSYFFKAGGELTQGPIVIDTDTFNQLEQVGEFFG